MTVKSCIPVIPSANLEKSLRLWVDGLGFEMDHRDAVREQTDLLHAPQRQSVFHAQSASGCTR
jgi:hypothetical protein